MRKIHNPLLFTLLAVLSLSSCHGNVNGQNGKSGDKVYSINLDKDFSEDVSIFDFCTNVELRVLDDSREAMMDARTVCSKAFGDTSIFFLSREDDLIREFDYDGKLLRVVNRHGRGPGEFTMADDMLINKYTNTLDILNPQGVIYQYSLDSLTWERTINIDFSGKIRAVHYFRALSPGKYLLCSVTESPQLYIYSEDSGLEDVEIDNVLPEWILGTSFSPGDNPLYEIGGELKYVNRLDGSIYTLEGSLMKPQYKWDMGEHQIDINQIEPDKDIFYYERLARTKSIKQAFGFGRPDETDRYLLQNFRYKGNDYCSNIVFDKTDKSIRVFKKTKENVFTASQAASNNCTYFITDPEYIDLYINESILNDEKSLEAYRSLKDDSNMVLIKYHLKK